MDDRDDCGRQKASFRPPLGSDAPCDEASPTGPTLDIYISRRFKEVVHKSQGQVSEDQISKPLTRGLKKGKKLPPKNEHNTWRKI